jgi:hypothetical protein
MPSAFAVLKVNFSSHFSQKSLRLKVYSLGTGTKKGLISIPTRNDEK